MTEVEQRIAIAELCGITFRKTDGGFGPFPHGPNGEMPFHVPDYLHDLNACKELIEAMRKKSWPCELDGGLDATWTCTFHNPKDRLESVYGTADTPEHAICRAFLEHHGKWKD